MGELGDGGTRFLDNRRIEGRIPEMLDEALMFVKKNMSVRTIIDETTGKRTDRSEYPLVAIREAILNSLVHRDYSVHTEGTPIQIIFYKDRLEISNPGGLYGRLTISQLGEVRADTRNPALARMLEVLHLVENRYSGIPTIRREMREAGLPAPEFSSNRGAFRVVFYNGTSRGASDSVAEENTRRNLVQFCNIPRSREEIARFLGIQTTYYAVKKFVLPLVDKGLLTMTILDKPSSRNQKFVSTSSSHISQRPI
jgi:ATP-dependent DNA helicase RecG